MSEVERKTLTRFALAVALYAKATFNPYGEVFGTLIAEREVTLMSDALFRQLKIAETF